ncbi:alpha/beta fold hydrolase [Geminicoccus harenae]|uniref:alpha/beta fold hydrolase n=1 Tax=Geminicoccus harenae TaxID=2498453 RepID=UPI001C94FE3C|nr:alpha/beta hydrolase [Geminicoccus harenae]
MAHAILHDTFEANGTRLHYARCGQGRLPILLLHGWPEFWFTWEPVMVRLADRFDMIAPDLRGFGNSRKPDAGPSDRVGSEVHARDLLALLDHLDLGRVGIVGHDVGAVVAQAFARMQPERLTRLFFFDCPYPGIGSRWAAPGHLAEIWYQSFHLKPWAADLVGSSRKACRVYFGNMLRHWAAGNPAAFEGEVLEAWVDNFLKPGNLQGGFDWYLSRNAARSAAMQREDPQEPPIAIPTCIRWGALDPVLKVEWMDRLEEYFTDLDAAPLESIGHFPRREDPDRASAEIAAWFGKVSA